MPTPNETVTLSYKSKLRLNGTPFGVTGGTMKIVYTKHEVGDSETGRDMTHKRGRRVMNLSCNFYGKEDVDYHGSPLLLSTESDETVEVEVLPWGDGFTGYLANFSMFDFGFEWSKDGELNGSISDASSNGPITLPVD